MTNKPHIYWAPNDALAKLENRHNNAPCILTDSQAELNDVALIRLIDHERLQAEAERLQAECAADKARIAELEECMKYARTVMSVTVRSESISLVCHRSLTDEIARIDAALSQPKVDA